MDSSDITLDRIRTFVRVAERGSLSAVAREIGAGQSTITRQLRELETAVGAPLLSRTTRGISLTEEGRRYYEHCNQLLRQLEQATDEVRSMRGAVAGTVRISCTAAFGLLHVTPLIFAFQEQHPEIEIDFSLSDERIDLVRTGFDIAIRLAPLIDSSLKLHQLGFSERTVVGAPAYLESRGRPEHPQDLASHEVIRMTNVAGSDVLEFRGPDGSRHLVATKGRLRVDHGLAAREAFIAARGIGASHRWLIQDLVQDGRLEQLLTSYTLSRIPLSMLIVPERAGIARVRRLVEYLSGGIRRVPGIMPAP